MSDQRFLVTARKYRPQRFDELVAQEHVTGTLKNAVRLDRLAHAYLFTGPRGVGKTTAARILAKAINCTAAPEERPDGAEPCRTCESCRSFEEGRNLNIIEIDAASNRSVEDARQLRETVRVPPQGGRRKVYIVDEVHMLTKEAFNTLLKTLEEPPPHVLFIFATTEPHKVLATIQSRCQRFDFRRIPVPEIVERLRGICGEEAITADDGSLMLIARRGDGALRDALSVFDHAVSLCGDRLTHAELVEALGVVDEDLYFRVTDNILRQDTGDMLATVDSVVRAGYDMQEFLDGLAEHLRNLLVARTMPDTDLIEASEATRERYATLSGGMDETLLLRLMTLVDQAMDQVRASRQPRLRLELALLRMAALPASVDLRAVLARVEDALPASRPDARPAAPRSSAAPAAAEARHAAGTAPGRPADTSPKHADPDAVPDGPDEAPSSEWSAAPPSAPEPAAPPVPEPAPATRTAAAPAPAPRTEPPAPAPAPAPEPAAPDRNAPDAPPPGPPPGPTLFDSGPEGASGGRAAGTRFGRPALEIRVSPGAGATPAAVLTPESDVDVAADDGVGDTPSWWPKYIERVKDSRIHVGALLHHASASTTADGILRIEVPDEFHVRVLREEADTLDRALDSDLGRLAPSVRVVRSAADPAASHADESAPDPEQVVRALCEEYPALRLLMERFGGEIVW